MSGFTVTTSPIATTYSMKPYPTMAHSPYDDDSSSSTMESSTTTSTVTASIMPSFLPIPIIPSMIPPILPSTMPSMKMSSGKLNLLLHLKPSSKIHFTGFMTKTKPLSSSLVSATSTSGKSIAFLHLT